MALPNQVRKQIKDAERAMATVLSETEIPSFVPPNDQPPAEPAAVVEPPPAPQEPPPKPETVPVEQFARVEQQLRSLQGIHRSIENDRAQLRKSVEALTGEVNRMKQELEEAKRAPSAAVSSALTPEEIAEYTPELLSVIERKAQEALGPAIEAERKRALTLESQVRALTEHNGKLESLLANVTQQTAENAAEKFLSSLGSILQDWETTNNDPAFMTWLDTFNPLTGRPYAVDFYAARDRFDAIAVAEFFKTYRGLKAAPRHQTVAPLASQISPESGGGANTATPKAGEIWTPAKIAQFYKDRSNGKYAKNPQQAKALERDIFAAQAEGRIAA